MSPNKNHEEPLIKRLARSRALNSRNPSRDASMSPTRYDQSQAQAPGAGVSRPPGQYVHNVQYIPCAFILPNYGNVSVSMPTLNNQQQFQNNVAPVFPHRKLSKLSNLVWTSSVSQPDLTRTITTPTVSPATSVPTSRASSPAPPSISARGSPHGVPSPYLSPMESRQDLSTSVNMLPPMMSSSMSPATSLPGLPLQQPVSGWQGGVLAPAPMSSTAMRSAMSGQDVIYLNTALNQLAMSQGPAQYSQHDGNGNSVPILQPAQHYSHVPGQPDNTWYYVQQGPGPGHQQSTVVANVDSGGKSGSCSPRHIALPRHESHQKKPCAVIAPIAPSSGQSADTLVGGKHQSFQGSQPSNGAQSAQSAIIRNSSPVPTVSTDNELRPSTSGSSQHDPLTESASLASLKLRERSNNGTCPDNINPNSPGKRSIGTSCTDLQTNNTPFVVETCQICTLFHPKIAAESSDNKNSPCFVYSPCLHGHQLMVKSGNKTNQNNINKSSNKSETNPVRYNKNLGMEQIKR